LLVPLSFFFYIIAKEKGQWDKHCYKKTDNGTSNDIKEKGQWDKGTSNDIKEKVQWDKQ
jgi:hypothetical protein